jgi:molybdopterin converting factor small subunit
MAVLRLFAGAREAAGTGREMVGEPTVGAVLTAARLRHGDGFARVLRHCQVWVNGEPAADDQPVGEDDEIAVLPPVSGGDGW